MIIIKNLCLTDWHRQRQRRYWMSPPLNCTASTFLACDPTRLWPGQTRTRIITTFVMEHFYEEELCRVSQLSALGSLFVARLPGRPPLFLLLLPLQHHHWFICEISNYFYCTFIPRVLASLHGPSGIVSVCVVVPFSSLCLFFNADSARNLLSRLAQFSLSDL